MKSTELLVVCLLAFFLPALATTEPLWWLRFESLAPIKQLANNSHFQQWKTDTLNNDIFGLYIRLYGPNNMLLALLGNWASVPQWLELRAQSIAAAGSGADAATFSNNVFISVSEFEQYFQVGLQRRTVPNDTLPWLPAVYDEPLSFNVSERCASKVERQGICEACWAFATADLVTISSCAYNFTSEHPINVGPEAHASVQNLIDCAHSVSGPGSRKDQLAYDVESEWSWNNAGCSMGYYDYATTYILGKSWALDLMGAGSTRGLESAATYPLNKDYMAEYWWVKTRNWDRENGQCLFQQNRAKFYWGPDASLYGLPSNRQTTNRMEFSSLDLSETEMGRVIAYTRNAVASSVFVSLGWLIYSNGVYSDKTSSAGCFEGGAPGHAIIVNGFGRTSLNTPFWYIKNTWGQHWGIGGYMWLKRNLTNSVRPNSAWGENGVALCSLGTGSVVVWPPNEVPENRPVHWVGEDCLTTNW